MSWDILISYIEMLDYQESIPFLTLSLVTLTMTFSLHDIYYQDREDLDSDLRVFQLFAVGVAAVLALGFPYSRVFVLCGGVAALYWIGTYKFKLVIETVLRWGVSLLTISAVIFIIIFGVYITYSELMMSSEEKVARAEKIYQAKKEAYDKDHEFKLREAKAQVKLAEIEAKQRALYSGNSETNIEHDKQLAKAQAELSSLQAQGADYSKLSQTTISSSKSEPVDEQTKLVLSALWLGACFFLQRLFEKLFKDKGYALLTVCAAGFLLAFFTANYFLLGGSVTGGIMGSVGDRT